MFVGCFSVAGQVLLIPELTVPAGRTVIVWVFASTAGPPDVADGNVTFGSLQLDQYGRISDGGVTTKMFSKLIESCMTEPMEIDMSVSDPVVAVTALVSYA